MTGRGLGRLGAGLVWIGLLWAGLSLAIPVQAGIVTDPEHPSEGETARVLVTDADDAPLAGAEVVALYRPGSEVEHREIVGTTGPDGAVAWTPQDAGLVTLQITKPDGSSESTNLAVRYQGVPAPGLAIMILAGIVLFGGVIRGFRSLKSLPPDLPPDT